MQQSWKTGNVLYHLLCSKYRIITGKCVTFFIALTAAHLSHLLPDASEGVGFESHMMLSVQENIRIPYSSNCLRESKTI